MRKMISLLLTICILSGFGFSVCAAENVTVKINDTAVQFDRQPFIENDRTLVPIRAIAEAMQFDVGWDQSTQKITLENFNTILTLYVNQDSIEKNLKYASEEYKDKITTMKIDVPAKVVEDRTYIPLRAISELFGATVDWNQQTSTASVTYNNTLGEPVTFEDEGIEYLTRLAIMLNGIDTSDKFNIETNFFLGIQQNTAKLYDGYIYKGMLDNISTLGINTNFTFNYSKVPIIYSINDIRKFPNLKNLNINHHKVTDISPITYNDSWNEINLLGNPIFNFTPLNSITVNHILLAGYYTIQFDYTNPEYTKDNYIQSEVEKNKYKLFAKSLSEIFSTLQGVIDKNITPDMTRKEKIEVINNWIVNNIQYDRDNEYFNSIQNFNTTSSPLYSEAKTLECTILHGYAVCEGFALAFEIFCDMLNIPCIEVPGKSYSGTEWGAHAWNLVQLEDHNLYHVDTTFNATSKNFTKYLLVSDDFIKQNHIWDESDIQAISSYKKQLVHFFTNPLE